MLLLFLLYCPRQLSSIYVSFIIAVRNRRKERILNTTDTNGKKKKTPWKKKIILLQYYYCKPDRGTFALPIIIIVIIGPIKWRAPAVDYGTIRAPPPHHSKRIKNQLIKRRLFSKMYFGAPALSGKPSGARHSAPSRTILLLCTPV